MVNIFYRVLADFILLLHARQLTFVLFGWLLPQFFYLYIADITITLLSWLVLGYCFVSKWEFALRKKINPTVNYNYSFSSYYTYKLTQQHISDEFLRTAGIIFITSMLVLQLSFKLFPLNF